LSKDRLPPYIRKRRRLTVCALHETFIRSALEELADESAVDVHNRVGFHDEPGAALIRLLEAEAISGGLSGVLYRDHLAYALTSRLLLGRVAAERGGQSENRLPVPRLRRVSEPNGGRSVSRSRPQDAGSRERLQQKPFSTDIPDCHRSNFASMLLRVRVKRAQALLRDRSQRLIDAASACGFFG
jgi:hypothetical protein